MARACITICPPSKASGIATKRQQAEVSFAARITSRSTALPVMVSMSCLRSSEAASRSLSITRKGSLASRRAPLYAAYPPMADKDDVISQPGDWYRLAATRFRRRSWLEG